MKLPVSFDEPAGSCSRISNYKEFAVQSAGNVVKVRSGVGSETRKRMRSRSGHKGQVVRKGDVWHGRFYVDVPGQEERTRKSVPIGPAVGEGKLTKSLAKNKQQEYLQELGVNKPSRLQQSLRPVRTFGEVVKWWAENELPFHKPSSRNSSKYIIKKHLRPTFGELLLDQVEEKWVQEWISGLHKADDLMC